MSKSRAITTLGLTLNALAVVGGYAVFLGIGVGCVLDDDDAGAAIDRFCDSWYIGYPAATVPIALAMVGYAFAVRSARLAPLAIAAVLVGVAVGTPFAVADRARKAGSEGSGPDTVEPAGPSRPAVAPTAGTLPAPPTTAELNIAAARGADFVARAVMGCLHRGESTRACARGPRGTGWRSDTGLHVAVRIESRSRWSATARSKTAEPHRYTTLFDLRARRWVFICSPQGTHYCQVGSSSERIVRDSHGVWRTVGGASLQ
ncbi:MAG TPA: hypothetical protein VF520_00030 [Thermoleophilaceae bacterium]|jgi:hypothetical protein